MEISVLFLGEVSRHALSEGGKLHLLDGSLVSDVFTEVLSTFPGIRPISKFLFISVNGSLVPRNHLVRPGDEVTFFFRSGGG